MKKGVSDEVKQRLIDDYIKNPEGLAWLCGYSKGRDYKTIDGRLHMKLKGVDQEWTPVSEWPPLPKG